MLQLAIQHRILMWLAVLIKISCHAPFKKPQASVVAVCVGEELRHRELQNKTTQLLHISFSCCFCCDLSLLSGSIVRHWQVATLALLVLQTGCSKDRSGVANEEDPVMLCMKCRVH
jgi:hypothetical protein